MFFYLIKNASAEKRNAGRWAKKESIVALV
jgi:hypothetical protein